MPARPNKLIKPVTDRIRASRAENQNQHRRFPEDLGAHAIVLNFKSYKYGGGSIANQLGTGSVVLPLPAGIKDSYSIDVGSNELGLSGNAAAFAASQGGSGALLDEASKLIDSTKSVAEGATDMSFSNIMSNAGDAMSFLTRAGLTSIAPQVATGVDVGQGRTINPHVAVAFNGIGLKNHEFNWTLSPKNPREADKLKEITDFIKTQSLPSYRSPGGTNVSSELVSRAMLEYPAMVDVFFLGIDQEYFFYFKTCMISAVNIDYTPNGIALNRGGKPSIVNLGLSLIETEIHTKDDYR